MSWLFSIVRHKQHMMIAVKREVDPVTLPHSGLVRFAGLCYTELHINPRCFHSRYISPKKYFLY